MRSTEEHMSLKAWWIRYSWRKNDAKRDAGLTTPEDIERKDNISYGAHKMNVLDVYRPKNATGKLPVIVSVHGGGWVYGDKELYQHYCMSLAQRGFAVVNFTYRLSPEHKFPCHLEDTVKVFDWVLQHGEEYGFDVENVFAVGDSAGGHILSLFCVMCSNPEYAAKYAFKVPERFMPKAVALNCGVYNINPESQPAGSTLTLMKKSILPKGGTDEELRAISTVNFITEKFPPCYLMTANEDFLREQPKDLMEKLDAVGVPYVYKLYGDETNVLGHVFHLDMYNETGKLCNDEECAFFRNYIK